MLFEQSDSVDDNFGIYFIGLLSLYFLPCNLDSAHLFSLLQKPQQRYVLVFIDTHDVAYLFVICRKPSHNASNSMRYGDPWWRLILPAGIFRHGKVDVAMT